MAAATMCSVGQAEQNLIWSRREDLEWVDDVGEVQCTLCEQVLIFHYTANCGHKFCPDCKDSFDARNAPMMCPHPECEDPVFYIEYEWDPAFDLKLSGLRARCPNRYYGCSVVEPLSELVDHIDGCKITQDKVLMAVMTQLASLTLKMDKLSSDMRETDQKVNAFGTEVMRDLGDIQADLRKQKTELGSLSDESKKKNALIASNTMIGGRISALRGKIRSIAVEEEDDEAPVKSASREHGAAVAEARHTLTKLTNIGQELLNLQH